jgi:cytochrome oxidase Cu insertion factor (SCO1/SenC/PrrC family)
MRRRRLAVLLVFSMALASIASGSELDDLLADFQVVPLGDQAAPPFTLEALAGPPITLTGLRGRAVLLYFWDSG